MKKSSKRPNPIVIDTNCLLYYFVQPRYREAKAVSALLKTTHTFIVPDVVFIELEYLLRTKYHHSRIKISQALNFISNLTHLHTNPCVSQALSLYQESQLDLADCFVAAQAKGNILATFDQELLQVSKAQPYWE